MDQEHDDYEEYYSWDVEKLKGSVDRLHVSVESLQTFGKQVREKRNKPKSKHIVRWTRLYNKGVVNVKENIEKIAEEMVEGAYNDNMILFLRDNAKTNQVDVKDTEMLDIQACVHEVLRNAVKSDPDVSDVILCGSMAEGTRVWGYAGIVSIEEGLVQVPLVEFDFLAVMRSPVTMNADAKEGALRIRNASRTGYKQVVSDSCSSSISRHSPIPFELKTREELREKVLKYLRTSGIFESSRLSFDYSVGKPYSIEYRFTWQPFGLIPSPTYKPPQTALTQQPICAIKVDFMPAFQYQDPDEASPCLLVPKRDPEDDNWYFLQSYCREEIQTLVDTSQVHRDVYMLLKSFNNHIESVHRMPSYHIKTAVLRHIEKCQEPDLVDCLRDILRFLRECYSEGELLTFKGDIKLKQHRYRLLYCPILDMLTK